MNNPNELKAGMLVALSMSRKANVFNVRHLIEEEGVAYIELIQTSGNRVGCGYAHYSTLNHPSNHQLCHAIDELDELYDATEGLEGREANHPTFPYYSALRALLDSRMVTESNLATA